VDHPLLVVPSVRPNARPNWQSFPVFARAGASMDREALLRWFAERGIAARRGVANSHEQPAYAGRGNWSGGPLPVSEDLRRRTLMVPLFHGMTGAEEALVLQALRDLRGAA